MLKSGYQKEPDFVENINWPINGYFKVHGIVYYIFNEQVQTCVPNTPNYNSIIKNTILDGIHFSLGHAGFTKRLYKLINNFCEPNITRNM